MDVTALPAILDSVSPSTLIASLAAVLVVCVYRHLQDRGLPPGPWGVPLLGYLPFLRRKDAYLQLDDMKKKYGDVSTFRVIGRLYVNLGSAKAVREALVARSDCFQSRPIDYNIMNTFFKQGIINSNGEKWRILRKFFLNLMRECGMLTTKNTLGGPMSDGMVAILADFQEADGQPVSATKLMANRCNGILKGSLFGEGGISLEEIETLNAIYSDISHNFSPFNLLLSGNIAKYIIFPLICNMDVFKKLKVIESMIKKIVQRNKDSFDENNADDIIGSYYKERKLRQKKGDPTYKYFTDEDLVFVLVQFIGEGANSAATFVSTFVKALLDHPEQQEPILREILEVVGEDRLPTIEDKSRMPYTNAFLHEVLRTAVTFPFFTSLLCTKETTIGGYRIPKGAVTLVNTWAAHNDPSVYDDPRKFDPSRFLVDGNKKRPELPINFGVGKRSCLGEGFVMMQTFLFLTTLVKNFRLSWVDAEGHNLITSDRFNLKKLMLCAKPRNKS